MAGDGTFRLPSNEYYISRDLNVLKVEYSANEYDVINGDDGYYRIKYITYKCADHLKVQLDKILDEFSTIDLTTEKVKLYSSSLKFYVNPNPKQILTNEIIPYRDSGVSTFALSEYNLDEYKVIKLRNFYEVTMHIGDEELVFFLGSEENFYSNTKFVNLIKLLNQIIREVYEKHK
jgi:hypothetical protein